VFVLFLLSTTCFGEEVSVRAKADDRPLPPQEYYVQASKQLVFGNYRLAFTDKKPDNDDLKLLEKVLGQIDGWYTEYAKEKKITKAPLVCIGIRFHNNMFQSRDWKTNKMINVLGCTRVINNKQFWIKMAYLSDWDSLWHEFGHGFFDWDHPVDDEKIKDWVAFCQKKFSKL